MKCKYNDCGWCYATPNTVTNDQQGQCIEPEQCPERQAQVVDLADNSNGDQDE